MVLVNSTPTFSLLEVFASGPASHIRLRTSKLRCDRATVGADASAWCVEFVDLATIAFFDYAAAQFERGREGAVVGGEFFGDEQHAL
jgi:hypothetical protein